MKKLLSIAFVITLISGGEVRGSSPMSYMHKEANLAHPPRDVLQTKGYYRSLNKPNAYGCYDGIYGGCS